MSAGGNDRPIIAKDLGSYAVRHFRKRRLTSPGMAQQQDRFAAMKRTRRVQNNAGVPHEEPTDQILVHGKADTKPGGLSGIRSVNEADAIELRGTEELEPRAHPTARQRAKVRHFVLAMGSATKLPDRVAAVNGRGRGWRRIAERAVNLTVCLVVRADSEAAVRLADVESEVAIARLESKD